MPDYGLIGRCGLFCEACIIYGVSHRTEGPFVNRRNKMAEHFECKPEQVACDGCRQLTATCWGNDCEILKCVEARGYRYCDECGDIDDCDKFAELDSRYGGLRESMARLRDAGPDKWLAEQRDKMSCPECGGVLYYVNQKVCPICGEK
jgi:hypothetical protein